VVQLKYFGDSRDYFKYDLVSFILKNKVAANYVFVPMLTDQRFDNEGNKAPKPIDGKSKDLLTFIANCSTKDLNHWERWLDKYSESYKTIQPVNRTFFNDSNRAQYWGLFTDILKEKNALIFVDPDTGLETGSQSYLRRMGREKYMLNTETAILYKMLDETSYLMIYQHLPNNKHIHKASVDKKIKQASKGTGSNLVCAYREDDLAFLFLAKRPKEFISIVNLIKEYFETTNHDLKSIHISPNQAVHLTPSTSAP